MGWKYSLYHGATPRCAADEREWMRVSYSVTSLARAVRAWGSNIPSVEKCEFTSAVGWSIGICMIGIQGWKEILELR